jgi:hypothetical protein
MPASVTGRNPEIFSLRARVHPREYLIRYQLLNVLVGHTEVNVETPGIRIFMESFAIFAKCEIFRVFFVIFIKFNKAGGGMARTGPTPYKTPVAYVILIRKTQFFG